jgi:Permuted papain-like amidase enzyme, YaeF/YiiX, C92 family
MSEVPLVLRQYRHPTPSAQRSGTGPKELVGSGSGCHHGRLRFNARPLMTVPNQSYRATLCVALFVTALTASSQAYGTPERTPEAPLRAGATAATQDLARGVRVGDVVFIRVSARPFREVSDATGSWTNHVGIVIGVDGDEPLIGESTFPLSRTTSWSEFIARSEAGRVAIARLPNELTVEQQRQVRGAADRRASIFYDTGFNLRSERQFCSRYVREVVAEALGVTLGQVETFADLLKRQPQANLGFWKFWYFGRIPWERETVTPASLLESPALTLVFDGATRANASP